MTFYTDFVVKLFDDDKKFYICNNNGSYCYYLHKDGNISKLCGAENFFNTYEEATDFLCKWLDFKTVVPCEDDVKRAIKTLHEYFSQPAIKISASMMWMLNEKFIDVIRKDPSEE